VRVSRVFDLLCLEPLFLELAVARDLRSLGDEVETIELLTVSELERAEVAANQSLGRLL